MTDPARHAPPETLSAYHEQGVSGVLQIAGRPPGLIRITPQHHRLSLLLQVTDNLPGPDVGDFANVAYQAVEDAGTMWHRLDVTYDGNLPEVYPFLCAVSDRVQLAGESFSAAVEAVLQGLADILEGRGGLSREKQVGLFGELLVLLSLAATRTPDEAITSWRGPDREEHDFRLETLDVEVKTTTSEQRSHWIAGPTQLLPTPGRDLLLLSIQITGAGQGPGATLPELVARTRALHEPPTAAAEIALERVGYRTAHADLYAARWSLRSTPTYHLVDDDFPAITRERLARSVPQSQRITDLRYRLDLDGMPATADPFPVTFTAGAAHP